MPSGLGVYRNADRSDPVTGSTELNADEDTTLYVEGRTIAALTLRLVYKLNDQELKGGDEAKVTVFRWIGPLNVPQYGEYKYTASGNLPAGATWSGADGGAVTAMATPLDAWVRWGGGPTVGKAQFQVNENYTWGLDVNVVQVTVTAPDADVDFATFNIPYANVAGDFLELASGSAAAGGPNLGLEWKAKVTLTGPGDPRRGIRFINVGFAQNLTVTALNALYENDQQRTSALQGNKYFDMWDGSTRPYFQDSEPATFFDPSDAKRSDTIESNDSPGISVWLRKGDNKLTHVNIKWDFELYVVASTEDTRNNPEVVHFGQAKADWSWDASADVDFVDGAFVWNSAQAVGVTAPAAWVAIQGERPLVDGSVFNDLVRDASHWGP